jgi:ubiquitin carboxyl-terminal hydrolase 22/27/51
VARTALEPFLDLSLDLEQGPHAGAGAAAAAATASAGEARLAGCLQRFCKAERVRALCQRCGQAGDAIKQYTVHRLPPVLAVHLKRFEHRTAATAKVDGHVAFPLTLDMTPFLTAYAARTAYASGTPHGRVVCVGGSTEADAGGERHW